MDLEVKEVAELLHVSEETLHDWIQAGKVPAYFLKERFHCNREEIEDWLMQQRHLSTAYASPYTSKKGGLSQFQLFRALNKGDVYTDIEGDDKLTIIQSTMQRISRKVKLDPEVLTELFMEREDMVPTAIGQGFAIPHARDFHLPGQHDVLAIVFLKKPIPYDALDGEPVHTLFFLLACNDKRHLSLLAKIAHVVSSSTMRANLATQPNKEQLLPIIQDWEAQLPTSAMCDFS